MHSYPRGPRFARGMIFRHVQAMGLAIMVVALPARAAQPSSEAVAFFEKEVRPLLAAKCFRCHGAKKQESGLRLDSRAGLLRGGDRGPAIIPGAPDKSLLLAAVRQQGDLKMPPSAKLRIDQLDALVKWVKLGAPWPDEARTASTRGGAITRAEREFWSFQPVRAPRIPAVDNGSWPSTPVDHFVLARLEAEGLEPVRAADKRTLLRRVTFDLTGLPPTPNETQAFLADDSPAAWDGVIDRLLASKHYGERWGRHWLDLVRYADTAGDGADYPVREAYKYRNYVIDSFNADKPYDEFIREQIAGDLLPDRPAEKYAERVIATGFLAIGKRFGYDLNNEFQHLDIADVLETLGRSVLGLSTGCARCHDHKYDPINMSDYYGLYGILASTRFAFPGGEELKRPMQFAPLLPPDRVAALEKKRQQEVARLDAKLLQLALLPAASLGGHWEALGAARAVLTRQRQELAAAALCEVAYGVGEGTPANAPIQKRGEPDKLGPEVPRHFLEILGGDPLPPTAKGSGRLELADWLTRPSNPLTARVLVNRVWQYHFGRGLVATASDFGTRGEPPSHPELLDYLAARFMREGWSIKALHRLLLRSRVYQLASEDHPRNARLDPLNRWLWQQRRHPLDAESLRDAMLAVSGLLDRTTPGPHPFPPVQSWKFTIHYPFHAVYDSNHRSVYLMVQRARRHPYLALFDGADPNLSTAERLPTTTPTQALYLMNDPFVHAQAQAFASRLLSEAGADAARVRLAFELAHGREVTDADVREALDFVRRYRAKLAALNQPADQQMLHAWAALGRVLMTSNAFLYVD